MRPIGFSTGALAYADFRQGLILARSAGCTIVELSALREPELAPMLDALDDLDLGGFRYVSIHAPSKIEPENEALVAERLRRLLTRGWPIVVHPDAIRDFSLWREFGALLCIENMDKRKPIGRTAKELGLIFDQLPEASLCFDIGHARQVDTTMTEAYLILKEFGGRLGQVHISEVSTSSRHNPLSYASMMAFQEVAHRIPGSAPIILETPAADEVAMRGEIAKAREALPVEGDLAAQHGRPGLSPVRAV